MSYNIVSVSRKFSLDYIGFYGISRLNRWLIANSWIGFAFKGFILFEKLRINFSKIQEKFKLKKPDLDYLDQQDLSRFSDQDIVLESENQIQKYLPEVLGQALARTWIDKRFLDAFYNYPVEVLERGGVYLPDSVSVEFKKEKDQRPKVIVYENDKNSRRKLLELKLVMVAEQWNLKHFYSA